MLKGHVFAKQLFENQIFALFVNTFLNGNNGISDNYLDGMELSYSGSNVTIGSGAVCIQGRFLEEDNSTTISAGTDEMYCKLVIEIDLDKTNTENSFLQGAYKVVKSASAYPTLTQTNIVKNNSGVYQYELARFRTTSNGITDFQDMRTFLDFNSIYEEIREHIEDIDDGSAFVNKSDIAVVTGNVILEANTSQQFDNNESQQTSWTVAYPQGFNKDNCVLISFASSFFPEDKGYGYGKNRFISLGMLTGNIEKSCYFNNSNIQCYAENWAMNERTLYYKLVLLKIA